MITPLKLREIRAEKTPGYLSGFCHNVRAWWVSLLNPRSLAEPISIKLVGENVDRIVVSRAASWPVPTGDYCTPVLAVGIN